MISGKAERWRTDRTSSEDLPERVKKNDSLPFGRQAAPIGSAKGGDFLMISGKAERGHTTPYVKQRFTGKGKKERLWGYFK